MLSDAETKPGDALPNEGQPSTGGESKPSTQPEVFTKEQVEERHSKLDKTIATLTKQNEASKRAIEDAKTKTDSYAKRLAEIEEEKARGELEGIRDNPDALSLWQARQAHREAVKELETQRASFEQERGQFLTDLEEVKSYKTFKGAMEIASKPEYKGVDAQKLVDLTDGSSEKMEGLARLLKAGMGQPAVTVTLPDSGKSTGGAGEPTAEELAEMPIEQYAQWYNSRQKRR